MQKSGVDHVIFDMCMFLHREVFNVKGRFFDKNDTLAEFPQLCRYQRFDIWTMNSIDVLRNNVNIDDQRCENCLWIFMYLETIWLLHLSFLTLVILCEYCGECCLWSECVLKLKTIHVL
jgi:hypothetical protein